ncbi:Stress enhanced protein 1, chloroplastic-like protein [Drosera capensis]
MAAISHFSSSLALLSHFHPSALRISTFTPISSSLHRASTVMGRSRGRMMTGGRGRGRVGVVRCEQSSDQGSSGVDVWLGRFAMVGFVAALGVEIGTGKGLLENFGLTSPLPTAALALTAVVGVLTAIFIFQSASKN